MVPHFQCSFVQGMPALHVLIERHSIPAYRAMWSFLAEKAPGIGTHLQTVVCNGDDFLTSSLRERLPSIRIRFSLQDFSQMVTTKWFALGLPLHTGNPNAEVPVLTVLELAWGLPLLHHGKIEHAANEIGRYAQQFETTYEMITVFIGHLKNYWVPLAREISMRNTPFLQNHVPGVFQMHIMRLLGKHQTLFKFLGE